MKIAFLVFLLMYTILAGGTVPIARQSDASRATLTPAPTVDPRDLLDATSRAATYATDVALLTSRPRVVYLPLLIQEP